MLPVFKEAHVDGCGWEEERKKRNERARSTISAPERTSEGV
jgi:hypothetical protein